MRREEVRRGGGEVRREGVKKNRRTRDWRVATPHNNQRKSVLSLDARCWKNTIFIFVTFCRLPKLVAAVLDSFDRLELREGMWIMEVQTIN